MHSATNLNTKRGTPPSHALAHQAFARISQRFPHLCLLKVSGDPAELGITLPAQDGLDHPVWLGHDGLDALHFSVGHFWLEWHPFLAPDIVIEWSPCTNEDVVTAYVDAVSGFLSGSWRVLEHHRGYQCMISELQAPIANGWKTIAGWHRGNNPSLQGTTQREIRNGS